MESLVQPLVKHIDAIFLEYLLILCVCVILWWFLASVFIIIIFVMLIYDFWCCYSDLLKAQMMVGIFNSKMLLIKVYMCV